MRLPSQAIEAVFQMNEVRFEIYCAKQMYAPRWISCILKQLVMQSRRSYWRYGPVPISDKYDKKSSIYLARVVYTHKEWGNVEEYLSIRFVPSDDFPLYTEDLRSLMCERQDLVSWLKSRKEKIKGAPSANDVMRIVALSRISGIPPHKTGKQNAAAQNIIAGKLCYTGIAFSLINQIFLEECDRTSLPYRFISGIFRDELIEKALTRMTKNKTQLPAFTYAYELLDLPHHDDLSLNRNSQVTHVYEFPSYFLNMPQLHCILASLCQEGILPQKIFTPYIPQGIKPDVWMKDFLVFQKMAPILGNILSIKGPILNSTLTGERLREILDKHVKDGAQLHIMPREKWRASVKKYLEMYDIKTM